MLERMNRKKLQFIKSIYSNPLISNNGYDIISDSHQKIEFNKGDILLRSGQTANNYILVASGLLRRYVVDIDGNEVTTRFHSVGEFSIVVVSFFSQIPSRENIMAITDGVGWKISFESFMGLLKSVKGLGEWGRNWMANQLFMSEQRSVDILIKTATERYLDILTDEPELVMKIPLKYLASYLGVSDTSLSRIRKQISKT